MLLLSVVPATVITFVGWVGSPGRYVAYIGALPGFDILAGILAMPGILFAVLLAAVFSPQGFHGAERFIMFAPPVNWLGYFLYSSPYLPAEPQPPSSSAWLRRGRA